LRAETATIKCAPAALAVMPSAATLAKRAAAKAEKDAEKAALESRLDAAVARMEVEQPAAVGVVPPAQPPPAPSSTSYLTEVPSPSGKQLAQPVRGSFTPRRTNIEYLLEAASPGGTTMIQESFKRAAATPAGEDAEARARRLAAERARLCRARARLEAKLNPSPPLTTEEVDTALSVQELSTALERAGLGDIGTVSLRCSHLQAYQKFMAAKKACAVELVGVLDELSLSDIYALYPSSERPLYAVAPYGEFKRPDESRCGCGNALRFQCQYCESPLVNLVIQLEMEQNGESPPQPAGFYGDYHYGWNQTQWWRGRLVADWQVAQNPDLKHEKTMHFADRLRRACPGILVSDSVQGMALYRRISTLDLVLENWEHRSPVLHM